MTGLDWIVVAAYFLHRLLIVTVLVYTVAIVLIVGVLQFVG